MSCPPAPAPTASATTHDAVSRASPVARSRLCRAVPGEDRAMGPVGISDSGCAPSPRVSLASMAAITLSQRKELDGPLLGVALAAALAAAVLALYSAGHPYIPEDAAIERGVQSTSWGPLVLTFPVFSFIGDAKGAVLEAIVFVLILVFNRRAWILAAAASLTALWYVLLNHLVNRRRPTTP